MHTGILTENKIEFRDKSAGEDKWLYDLRKQSWNYYIDSPLPDRISHLWRYSNPEKFMLENPEKVVSGLKLYPDIFKAKELTPEMGIDAYWANNSMMKAILQTSASFAKTGALFQEMNLAAYEQNDLVKKYLGKLIPSDAGKFEALNLALWNTGILVYVPDNTVIEKPIYLYRHPTGGNSVTRLLVVLGKNAEATVIDDYKCPCNKDSTLFNSAVEIFVGESARVRYVNLQRLAADNRSYITQRTQLGRDAESYTLFASLGSGMSKVNTGTILSGRGAVSNMFGIAFGDDKQQFDHHTMHHHTAADSYSNIDFKVVLKEKAKSAYTGLIKIEHDATNCEAYQENRNLLLDRGAKAETIPELEILTDQVRCSHGATVGPLDQEMIFYLTSRGIARHEAIKIIVGGFVEPLLGKMPNGIGDTIRDIVFAKLEER